MGLRRFPLLATAHLDEIATLAENVRECAYPAGTTLATAGARLSALHLLLEGRVESIPAGRTWESPHVIGALEIFAERPIEHTCVAATDVRTLQLSAADVGELLEDNFGVMQAVLRELAARLLHRPVPPGARAGFSTHHHPLGLVERLLALRQTLPFRSVGLHALTMLAKACDEATWSPGSVIMRPDADAVGLVVLEGEVRIEDETRNAGDAIGMLEAIAGLPPQRHVQAVSHVRALRSTASAIRDVIEDHADVGLAIIGSLATALLTPAESTVLARASQLA